MNRLVVLLLVLTGSGAAQKIDYDFALDRSKPFAYLNFDHLGPRKPLTESEPNVGIWIKIVNNCRVPLVVPTFGAGVLDQIIVMEPLSGVTATAPIETEPILLNSILDDAGLPTQDAAVMPKTTTDQTPEVPMKKVPPRGYMDGVDLYSMTRIPPGGDLVFSVPINHVGDSWFLRVRAVLDVSEPRAGQGPYIELDFDKWRIPSDSRSRTDVSSIPKSPADTRIRDSVASKKP